MGGFDISKYQRETSSGKATKKTITFPQGSKGFEVVAKLQASGIDVPRLTEDLLVSATKE